MSYNVKKKRKKKEFSVRKSNNYDKRLHYGVEYVNLSKLCAPKGFSFLISAEFLLKRSTNEYHHKKANNC